MTMGYWGIHKHLSVHHGPASAQICPCGNPAQEWAYQGGAPEEATSNEGMPYSQDCTFYVPMCRLCHNRLDGKTNDTCSKGHAFTPDNMIGGKRNCRRCKNDANNARARRNRANRSTDPELMRRHLHKLKLQRDRKRKAKEASS